MNKKLKKMTTKMKTLKHESFIIPHVLPSLQIELSLHPEPCLSAHKSLPYGGVALSPTACTKKFITTQKVLVQN